jgi:hypothetical protein
VRHLIPNHSCQGLPLVCKGDDVKGLALDNECEVDDPCSDCENNDDLMPVPDGDAGKLYEYRVYFRELEVMEEKRRLDLRTKHNQ